MDPVVACVKAILQDLDYEQRVKALVRATNVLSAQDTTEALMEQAIWVDFNKNPITLGEMLIDNWIKHDYKRYFLAAVTYVRWLMEKIEDNKWRWNKDESSRFMKLLLRFNALRFDRETIGELAKVCGGYLDEEVINAYLDQPNCLPDHFLQEKLKEGMIELRIGISEAWPAIQKEREFHRWLKNASLEEVQEKLRENAKYDRSIDEVAHRGQLLFARLAKLIGSQEEAIKWCRGEEFGPGVIGS